VGAVKKRAQVSKLLEEVKARLHKVEAAVETVAEAELPFLKGIEDLPIEETTAAIAAIDASVGVANRTLIETRTFLVQKRVEAKRLVDEAGTCETELSAMQGRLEAAATKIGELRKENEVRKRRSQLEASAAQVSTAEAAMQRLTEAMAQFSDDRLGELSTEDASRLCEEISSAEQQARKSVLDGKKFLALQVQDTKNLGDTQRSAVASELSKMQSKMTQFQGDLEKLSKQCAQQEHRFVAKRIAHDADSRLKTLQADVEAAARVAMPMLASDKSELLRTLCVDAVADGLRSYMDRSGDSADALFKRVAQNGAAGEAEFAKFLDALPELTGTPDLVLTREQASAVFASAAGEDGQISLAALQAFLQARYVCAVRLALRTDSSESGEDAGTLEVGEVVRILEQEERDGAVCARCVLARDGMTAWVVLPSGDDGQEALQPAEPGTGRIESIEAFVGAAQARTSAAAKYAEDKMGEIANIKEGPLLEARPKLLQLKMKVSAELSKVEQLKKRVAGTKALVRQQQKEEQKRVQEGKTKATAAKSVAEANSLVEAAEEQAAKASEDLKGRSTETLLKELDAKALEGLREVADGALHALAEAKAKVTRVTEETDAYSGPNKSALLDCRVALTKLTARVGTSERRCRMATESVRAAYSRLVGAAAERAREALRAAVRQSGKEVDEMFDAATGGQGEMTEEQFVAFADSLPGEGHGGEQATLMFKELGGRPRGALRRGVFAEIVQEFYMCKKSITITDGFDVGKSTNVRKIDLGEVFEVLEGPREDSATQLTRARGRAVLDGAVGWVSVKGNKGTPFLVPAPKPYVQCAVDPGVALYERFAEDAPVVRKLRHEEVLEVLEGPRENTVRSETQLRATASKDDATGWLMLRDLSGTTFAALNDKLYTCRCPIALTDGVVIKEAKALRRIDVGELLELIADEPQQDAGVQRFNFRALKDGKVGWVTSKGNQGTVFVEATKSNVYVVQQQVALRERAERSSPVVRTLAAGEALKALGPPREDRAAARKGARVRSCEDGATGWVLFFTGKSPDPLRPYDANEAKA